MKIIIAGDGKVGATLTRQLTSEGYDVTIIDSKASPLESSVERYDVISVQGNCASMDVLRQAGVKDADLLIAATGADEVNLLCCTTAHAMNQKLHTIARVRNTPSRFSKCERPSACPCSSTRSARRQRRFSVF